MYDNIINNIKKCLPSNIGRYAVHEPIFSDHVKKEVNKCIQSTYVSSSGSYIDKLTEHLKKLTGAKYILLTTSGTSALFCALNEINIENHEVIVPSMTFVATANSVIYAGGSPVFIDSSDSSLNIDQKKLDDYLNKNYKVLNGICINKQNKKILKCIVVVHAYGVCADMNAVNRIAKKYKIEVIEDAAGALGSYSSNKHVGTFSRMGIISFNGNKIVTTGMGGALLIKYKKDYENINHKISTARVKHAWKVEHDMIGYNLRMANINAALGYGQIINIKKILKNKKNLYENYLDIFSNNKYCYIKESTNDSNNNWVTNLYLKDEYKDEHQSLIKKLHKNNIMVRELWKPMHLLPMFKSHPGSKMINSVKSWKTGFSLPSSYYK
ncbi:DegT/DnrJ/EryC1/StrS family aminotransferase [Gammaproteobacteria bacterium]|nr:DegT/DnrJ/EryC1/StrS family aminotransferase [Gammaproteobacteria bacterium]|tara:strand:+ start:3455 stop:4600 length:1146 start_codon:yes stop_codon:yes gene_type:complete